jgi:hypothetical protein
MFSPSLVSMIVHNLLPGASRGEVFDKDARILYKTSWDAARLISDLPAKFPQNPWPRIPVVGRVTFVVDFEHWFKGHVRADAVEGVTFFWGRVPVDLLAGHLREYHGRKAEDHYVDLGTTVRAAGSNPSFAQTCDQYLKKSAANAGQAKVGAAIVDLGIDSTNVPENYNKRLRHAVNNNIELSDHAEKVLSVLLERLDSNDILPDTTVSCALVRPPAAMVALGKTCFQQSNAVEMLDAITALEPQLTNDNLPAAVNMSLGTHVGPHNGGSPLEEYIAAKLVRSHERFVVAAAGNDGGSGVAAKRELMASERDFLNLQSGPRCQDLLVEFWWDDSQGPNLTMEARIYEPLATGGRAFHGMIKLDPNNAGSALNYAPAGLPSNMASYSLFQAKCKTNLSCIAFAMSGVQTTLPVLEITFVLESTSDLVVNAWIVVCEDQPQTTFIQGGTEGTVRVPASESRILSVAGAESTGQMWEGSSRGPAAQYQAGTQGEAPVMAHLVTLSGESGTSYSSPRACADAIVALADPTKRSGCHDAIDLMCEAYGLQRKKLPKWDKRFGFKKVIV